jgi:hypothetical protein
MRKLTVEGKRASYTDRNGKKVLGNHLKWIVQWESKNKALVLQKISRSLEESHRYDFGLDITGYPRMSN